MCTDILRVVVGSRLHGLSTPDSDFDYRGVFINDLKDIVNPFVKAEEKRFIEGKGKDDTASELRKFVREVVSGNPNSIEVLFSQQVDAATVVGQVMQRNAGRFIDTQNVFDAYKNYSANQLNKMNLFTPDVRTPKFAVAYIRSLMDGVELLRSGTITNPKPDSFTLSDGTEIECRGILGRIKFTPFQEFESVRDEATKMFSVLQVELGKVFYGRKPVKADLPWIVKFVREAYEI